MAFATKRREKVAAEPMGARRPPEHAPEARARTSPGVPVFLQRAAAAPPSPPASASSPFAPSSSFASPPLASPSPSSSFEPGGEGPSSSPGFHPLLGPRLVIGGVNDPAEREADAVAAAVTAPRPAISFAAARVSPAVARRPESGTTIRGEAASALASASPAISVEPGSGDSLSGESDSAARRVRVPAIAPSASPLPGHGGGTAMSARTRSLLETRLAVDLAGVRVHRDPAAHEAAAALGARAFAVGGHIWLGRGESDDDVALMAHEIAHVLQGDGVVRRAPAAAPPAGGKGSKGAKGGGAKPGGTPGSALAPATSASTSAGTAATSGGGGEGGAASVPMRMPEPPAEMSAASRERLESVEQSNTEVAEAAADLPPAEEQTADARGAVSEPSAETEARSQEDVVETLDEREPPSPEIEALCERIYRVIRDRRPPNEDRLVEARPDDMARQAGTQVQGDVQGETGRVAGSYDSMDSPPAGTPEQTGQPLETPSASVDARPADAGQAAPDGVPAENVSLEADTAASAQQIEDAGMNGEVAAEAARGDPDGPIAEAHGAQGELSETARRDPAEVMRQQREALAHAEADMAQLQAGALAVLRASRSGTVASTSGQQTQMVGTEEQMRQQAGERARAIFADAQTRVNALLEPLPRTAMARWDAGKEVLAEEFKQSLARVKAWIDERHSGVGGTLLAGLDYLTGLPDWVTEEYDRAERRFGDGICDLAREVSRDVNTAVAACEAIVTGARRQISELFASLPASLQAWAQGEQARLGEQLDGLRDRATQARAQLNRDLVQRAGSAVQEVREQVHALRQAAGGLLGRIRDAVGRFLEDPAKFIIDGLLSLVGIDPSAFWSLIARVQQVVHDIADNPMGFANNLLAGIAQGFRQFFSNIGTHLLNGFMGWLFGGLASVGVTIPTELSLKGIVTFILQLMGITWPRIRQVLARHVGERNVALLERAYELVSTLIEKGPEGIFEMIQERLNPQQIIDQIIQAGIRYLTERLITAVSVRIIGMLNPAGAIAQAIEAIYRVLKWVFENAARIFQFVESVVNGMAAIVAGNIGGMANGVERALASLIAPVIDFLADYMGFGDLPDRIKETIEGFQAWVMGHIDRAVGWLVERARALLARMGIGGGQQPGQAGGDGELGETVRFSAGHEGHRLWVQTEGNRATLMVASDNPGPVETKLADWSGRVDTLPETREGGGNPRQEARSLIGDARTLLGQADTEADQLAAAVQRHAGTGAGAPPAGGAGGAAAAAPSDDPLEAKERALATVLQRLFTLFGDRPDFTVVYAAQIARIEQHVRPLAISFLQPGARGLPATFADWAAVEAYLRARPRIRDILAGPLNSHELGNWALPSQAKPAVDAGLAANTMTTANIDPPDALQYAERRKGIIHAKDGVFPNSRDALAAEVFDESRVPAANAVLIAEFTTRLRNDKFAHLDRADIRAALDAAEASANAGWVAVFATGGILLRSSPDPSAPPLRLQDVWEAAGRNTRTVINTVMAATMDTLAAYPGFDRGGRTDSEIALGIARELVTRMARTPLYVVRHTEIPRYVQSGAHVKVNPAASGVAQALYTNVAQRSSETGLSQLGGEIHHAVPLYLGGGNPERNLMRTEGQRAVEGTAHRAMHDFIDTLSIERYVSGSPSYRVQLRDPDLRREFPAEMLKIIIGTVYQDGSIVYRETDLAYKVASGTKGTTTAATP